ncbi:cyclin-like protein [Polychaeton citri CBS 116435]|uniref:RNA polymerase II holoenzyme cyclin-like subunit n=1 Tax=Polychaeton citri CBS 116435 TaxID=1314669 RepID=A0A9P4Q989_9PEZI|nr:cyclin-like protein [Polychaeton citri CBS 116435]
MAANFYDSSQAKFWTFTKPELANIRQEQEKTNPQLFAKHPMPDHRHINIFLQGNLCKLAKRMALRQQPLATAQIYMKRFYTQVPFQRTNPYLIMTTAVYLACKMEESPQHIRLMLGEAARQWAELGVTESGKIGECEFAMISTLRSRLILHHPYRSLGEFSSTLGLSPEEQSLAHNIVNDSYNTDLPLLHPPHVIAITAIFLAVVLRPANSQPAGLTAHSTAHTPVGGAGAIQGAAMSGPAAQSALAGIGIWGQGRQVGQQRLAKLVDWLADSRVDMNAVIDATQEMVSLYDVWESYNERSCKEAISRFMKDSPGK